MLAVLNRRIAVLSFTLALLFVYTLTKMLVSSFCISSNQPLPALPLLLAASRAYSRNELLTLCCYDVTPARSVRKAILSYRLWLQRYLRIHPAVWKFLLSSSVTPSVDNGETSLQSAERASDRLCTATLAFGCLNIWSLLNRLDDVMKLLRHQRIVVQCLAESWHDPESAVIGHLRCAGFNVIDRPRPRVIADDLSVNHGGIVVVAANDVVSPITSLTSVPTKFDLVAVRVAVGHLTGIVVTLYRPGSAAVQQTFFEELTYVLDRVATYNVPVYVVGDFNIRLDRLDDPHAAQLRLLVESYGLLLHDTGLTNKRGGTLDAVITRAVTGCPDSVKVMDVGFPDHRM
jgi:hypothetical protein